MDDHAPAWTGEALADPHRVADKARRVRQMFDAVAPTYRLVNTLASAGRDAGWRRAGVALAGVTENDDVLDVACGTGDFAEAFAAHAPRPQSITGADFAHNMLRLASERIRLSIAWCRADAQRLPFDNETFSIVSCAFGIRNFQSLPVGLAEMRRVLRPGGRAVILEFSMPRAPVLRWLYALYMRRIMPLAATLVARDRTGAYRYLPQSVVSFAGRDGIVRAMQEAGFASVRTRPLTAGIVTAYRAEVAP